MRTPPVLSRRAFSLSTGLAALGIALPGWLRGRDLPGRRFSGPPSCRLTEPNEMGPFHREGAPWRTALVQPQEPGQHLAVRGHVLGGDTCEPLRDALLDVWQADSTGHYDFQDSPQPQTPDRYRLRGLMLTGAAGAYGFTTVLPGNYEIAPNQTRAKHIHYLIHRTGYEPLITQLYFHGDPWNERDPLVRRSLIMPTRPAGTGLEVAFDIVLRREVRLDSQSLQALGEYVGEYVMPDSSHGLRVEWRGGRLIATFSGDTTRLALDSASHFRALEWAGRLTFVRDQHGAVAALLFDGDDGSHQRLRRLP